MTCEQCDCAESTKVFTTAPNGRAAYRLLCDNCGFIVAEGRICDRCTEPGKIYKATLRLPNLALHVYGKDFKTVKCKVCRCSRCAIRLPPRWRLSSKQPNGI